jgi:dihydroorotase
MPSPASQRDLLLFTAVRAVDPAQGLDAVVDVVVEGGRITRIGPGAATAELRRAERARTIDGTGLWLLPAFVDLHAHLREPGYEHKENIASGLAAAAAGGFGHVCAMPNTRPVNDCAGVTEQMLDRARTEGGPALHPIGAITLGQRGVELTDAARLKRAGAVALSDDGRCVTSSAVMLRALQAARQHDLPLIQHAEDHALTEGAQMHEGAVARELGLRGWPRVAEDIIVARDVLLAEATGARYHLAHVSTRGAVRILREAKSRGLAVTAEVTPHHLLLTDEAVVTYGTACKVNPPLRERADIDALRAALADGTIDAVATDHAPHAAAEKDLAFADAPPGMIGLELVVPLLLDLVRQGVFSLARLADALTRAPARIIGIEAPALRQGAPAAFCLIDPSHRFVLEPTLIRSKSKNTPFLGRTLTGAVRMTVARGGILFEASACPEPGHALERALRGSP